MNTGMDERERIFLKLFFKTKPGEVTDEELEYFRNNPDQIDEISAPVSIHKLFLWAGTLLGVVFVGLSKMMKFQSVLEYLPEGLREFGVDIVFEIGVALIGAAVTAYILGILLDQQQQNAARWRAEIRRRLRRTP
jgi:hypothetical protein